MVQALFEAHHGTTDTFCMKTDFCQLFVFLSFSFGIGEVLSVVTTLMVLEDGYSSLNGCILVLTTVQTSSATNLDAFYLFIFRGLVYVLVRKLREGCLSQCSMVRLAD